MQIQRGQRRARVKKNIQQANTESKSTMQSERILYGVKENNAEPQRTKRSQKEQHGKKGQHKVKEDSTESKRPI